MWFLAIIPFVLSACFSKESDPANPGEDAVNEHASRCTPAAQHLSEGSRSSCSVGEPTPSEALDLIRKGRCQIVCTGRTDSRTTCTVTEVTDLRGSRVQGGDIKCVYR